jgi:hypothetical protein
VNEARIQISKKAADGDLLNIRADSHEELAGLLPALQRCRTSRSSSRWRTPWRDSARRSCRDAADRAARAAGRGRCDSSRSGPAGPGRPRRHPQAVPQGQPDPAQYGQPCNKVLPNGTICQGTKTKLVPAGTSKTGKAYPAFYGCPNDHR